MGAVDWIEGIERARGLGLAAGAWMLTYALHSTLLLGAAWLAQRHLRSSGARELSWKLACLAGLLTASVQTWRGGGPTLWTLDAGDAAPLALEELPTVLPALDAAWAPEALETPDGAAATLATQGGAAPAREAAGSALTWSRAWPALLLAAWTAGALLLLARLGLRLRRLRGALRDRRVLADGGARERLDALRARAGLNRPVRLSSTRRLATPVALLGAEICVPERALAQLRPVEQEAMLAHELAHVARRDPLWLRVLGALEALLWFQPLQRFGAARAVEAGELCCDDWAVRHTGSGLELARCLTAVAGWSSPRERAVPSPTMARGESQLLRRVERLVAAPPSGGGRVARAATALGGAAAVLLLAAAGPAVDGARRAAGSTAAVQDGASLGELGALGYLSQGGGPGDAADAQREALGALGYLSPAGDTAGGTAGGASGAQRGALGGLGDLQPGGDAGEPEGALRTLASLFRASEARLEGLQRKQQGLKPAHSKYKALEREIAELKAELADLREKLAALKAARARQQGGGALGRRVEDAAPELGLERVGGARVVLGPDSTAVVYDAARGGEPLATVRLRDPVELERLDALLRKLLARSDGGRLKIEVFSGPARVTLEAKAGSTKADLLRVVKGCEALRDARVLLPKGPEPAAAVEPVRVRVELLAAGERVDPETGAPWSGEGPYRFDGSRRIGYSAALGPAPGARQFLKQLPLATDLPETPEGEAAPRVLGMHFAVEDWEFVVACEAGSFAQQLRAFGRAHPGAPVHVAVDPGVVFEEVVAAMGAVQSSGLGEIRFGADGSIRLPSGGGSTERRQDR